MNPKTRLANHPIDALLWIGGAIAILAVVYARIRLIDIPLERDEGEYAYAGQLILQGIAPYTLAYNMKFPGVYLSYAAIMAIFGQSIAGIHIGFLLVHLLTTLFLILIARRFVRPLPAFIAGAAYTVMAISPAVLGLAAHATHFINLFSLGGLLFLLKAAETHAKKWLFLSGVFLGLACLMKQHAVFFIFLGLLYLLLPQHPDKGRPFLESALPAIFRLCLGIACPLVLTGIWLWKQGVFDRFWFWTFSYAKAYASIVPLGAGLLYARMGFSSLIQSAPLLWVLAAFGFLGLFFGKFEQRKRLFLEAWLLMAFLSICPGFYFRQHYFVPLLPVLCVLIAIALDAATSTVPINRKGHVIAALLGCVALLGCFQSLFNHQKLYFLLSPAEASRAQYGLNPFPESLVLSRYIQQHTRAEDRIAVLGSEPQIYFYSQRHSATGYIYTYALMEPQPFAGKMQADMIEEIERAKPAYIVFVAVSTSWLMSQNSNRDIFAWFNTYRERWYDEVALMPISDQTDQTLILEARGQPIPSPTPYFLRLYARKSDGG